MQTTEVKSIKRINVVAVILVKKKSFLISKRPGNKIYSGFWEFPGGKVETNESLKSALKREIHEELDISIYEKDMEIFESYAVNRRNIMLNLNFFLCQTWLGNISANEGQQIKWIRKNQIKNFKFLTSNQRVLEKLKCSVIPHN